MGEPLIALEDNAQGEERQDIDSAARALSREAGQPGISVSSKTHGVSTAGN